MLCISIRIKGPLSSKHKIYNINVLLYHPLVFDLQSVLFNELGPVHFLWVHKTYFLLRTDKKLSSNNRHNSSSAFLIIEESTADLNKSRYNLQEINEPLRIKS